MCLGFRRSGGVYLDMRIVCTAHTKPQLKWITKASAHVLFAIRSIGKKFSQAADDIARAYRGQSPFNCERYMLFVCARERVYS